MSTAEPLRLRAQLTKEGRMRYLSHAEFSRALMMAAKRSGLPLLFSGRYRPHVKISLSPPIPIGMASECELVDLFLASYISPAEAELSLARSLPEGIRIVRCRLMGQGAKSVGKLINAAEYSAELPPESGAEGEWRRAVELFLERESVEFERVQPRRTRVVDLRPGVHRLEVSASAAGGSRLTMVLDDGTAGTVKPWEVLTVLARSADLPVPSRADVAVTRRGLYARRGDRLVSPMELRAGRPAV